MQKILTSYLIMKKKTIKTKIFYCYNLKSVYEFGYVRKEKKVLDKMDGCCN